MLEIYHVAYAVRGLERALRDFQGAMGGRATEPQDFDMLMRMPLDGPSPRRVRGRSAWLVGMPTPIEFWEGGPASPWHIHDASDDTVHLHHTCLWADDLDATAARFEAIGFEREFTPVHDGDGLLGFCYLRNRSGSRIELQTAADRPSVQDWIRTGTPKRLDWMERVKRF